MKEKELMNSIKEAIEKPIKMILLGKKGDGCYVLLDDFENIKYAYSFGINRNIQFDKALADKGIDIYKDIANVGYWNVKEDIMRYGEYSTYGRRGSYGRRGYDAKYRGHRPEDRLDEMYMNYQAYSEGREAYGRGSYGAREDSMMCLETMLESMEDFVKMLKEEASSQEEIDLIHKYIKKISEM